MGGGKGFLEMSLRGLRCWQRWVPGRRTQLCLPRRWEGRCCALRRRTGLGDPAGLTLGGVGIWAPSSVSIEDSTGMTGPSDTLNTVFDQRRALSDGTALELGPCCAWWPTSVRNELIHARNRGERYLKTAPFALQSSNLIIAETQW